MLEFEPFQIDLRGDRLWRREQPVKLRLKTWQVLRLLVERSGDLVQTDEFLDTVWSGAAVTPGTLTQSIAELRRILGDDASQPRFIETVHHRGYRFIAEVKSPPSPKSPPVPDVASLPPSPTPAAHDVADNGWLVGREAELDQLDRLMQEIRAGHRRIVFVTGEAGVGKTSLVRTFLKRLLSNKTDLHPWIVGGRCIELIDEGETYLPVLEALERLAQSAEATRVRTILQHRAPTWLGQMPRVTKPAGQASPSLVRNATPNRMLREFCYAAEALAAESTLVLWFEDLHWGDSATIDLLAALASRPEPCRLLVLVTYRPIEAAINAHPVAALKRELIQRQLGIELPLGQLDRTALRYYLKRRFAPGFEPSVVDLIYEKSEGNPLFMVTLVNHLFAENLLRQTGAEAAWKLKHSLEIRADWVPESLAALVELQLSHLDAEALLTLEAASVQGMTFGARAIAATIDTDVESVEKTLRLLAGRGGFLEELGAVWWSDGSVGERFRFLHSFCHDVLYRRQTAARLQRSHRLIAARLEQGFQDQPGPNAAKLALHFERGGAPERAVPYLLTAAAGVRQRAGDRQTVAYFERALELLARLPDSETHRRQELDLRVHLWKELNASGVFSTAEHDASLSRAIELCDQLGDSQRRAYLSSCRTRSLIIQCDLEAARAMDEQRMEIAQASGDPLLLAAAHSQAGDIAYWRGDFERALQEEGRCIGVMEGVDPHETRGVLGHDPAVLALGFTGWASWFQGRPDEARRHGAASVARAGAGENPLNVAFALAIALQVEQFRRDADAARALAASLMEVTEEYGFDLSYPSVRTILGWTASRTAGLDSAIAQLREGVSMSRRANTVLGLSHLLATIAELEMEIGAAGDALATIDEALAFVEKTGECFWEAEIHRLQGALQLLEGEDQDAEACFQRALAVARGQGARALELRAATSLSRLFVDSGRDEQAHTLLAPVYESFTEGFATEDLRDARSLIDALPVAALLSSRVLKNSRGKFSAAQPLS